MIQNTIIIDYYNENNSVITNAGFKVGRTHIKTNLFGLDKHIDTIKEFNASISGSFDLPLSLHDEYRVTKGDNKTLNKILKNIELLKDIPNKKKVSFTIFKEHFVHMVFFIILVKKNNYYFIRECMRNLMEPI